MITICYISENGIEQRILDAITSDSAMELGSDVIYTSNSANLVCLVEPTVLLLDTDGIPWTEVLNTIHTIKQANLDTKIIVIASSNEETCLLQIVETEIDSIVEKTPALHTSITEAVNDVLDNHYIMPETITQSFISRFLNLKSISIDIFSKQLTEHNIDLTRRESEIAYFMRHGLRNKDIAHKLQVKESAVKVHVSHIYKKTGSKKRNEIIKMLNQVVPAK
ncbi:helix-turn-helix transcriptional regulator [Virgibacillus sp. JSM 102003]